MHNAGNHYYSELMIKYLAGEANPEEAVVIDEWMKDPVNRVEYEMVLRLWNALGENAIPSAPNAESWRAIEGRLFEKPRKRPLVSPIFWYGTAAIFILGLVISPFLFRRSKSSVGDHSHTDLARIIEEAKDSIRSFSLKDGSFIALNKNSAIQYDASFNKNERHVHFSGEAFFSIAKNSLKPFVIETGELSIQVVGTSFNVRTAAEGGSVEVQVKTGIVQMMAAGNVITVTANQTGIYFKGSGKMLVKNGVDMNSMGYATGNFRFNDLSLIEVCRYLEKSFGVRIDIDRQKFGDCRVTAQFNHKPLPYILDVITATVDASYHVMNEQISIEGKGCQ